VNKGSAPSAGVGVSPAVKPARRLRGTVLCTMLGLGAAFGVAWTQPRLAAKFAALRETSDTYAAPPPEQAIVLSLGYRAALADLIYAHLLVSYGLHFQERRRFEHVGQYLDLVTALDPKFAQPYLYADTLLTLQPVAARQEDYVKAKDILLQGTRELPFHQRLWFTAGQYLAYLAPPHIEDEAEREQFRALGARLLSRACELVTDNTSIPYHCIAAAGLLNRSGEREALIQMLTRTLAVNDDEEIRQRALAALSRWVGEQQMELQQRRLQTFQRAWREDLPHISKEKLLLLGPKIDVAACVGLAQEQRAECQPSWRGFWEHYDAASTGL
jgi:hypothetical protein